MTSQQSILTLAFAFSLILSVTDTADH